MKLYLSLLHSTLPYPTQATQALPLSYKLHIYLTTREKVMKKYIVLLSVLMFFSQNVFSAVWKTIDTVKIDGVIDCLPGGGQSIYKSYPAGVYQFVLLPGTGISYNTPSKFRYTNSAFVMVLDNSASANTGEFHSYGLNTIDGNVVQTAAYPGPIGVEFFVQDWNCSDNSGSVKVQVNSFQ